MANLQAIINRLAEEFEALRELCPCIANPDEPINVCGRCGWVQDRNGSWFKHDECSCDGLGWIPVTWHPDAPWLARLLKELDANYEYRIEERDVQLWRRGARLKSVNFAGGTVAECLLTCLGALDAAMGGNHGPA